MSAGRASDRLQSFRGKRDFSATPEPPGTLGPPGTGEPRFVIHEHAARRLHWDLRLERDGVLASWALPRGMPLEPKLNHIAPRTEDHPLEYLDFSGEIPRGSYGAGSVRIWDRGSYECLKWEPRKIEVALHGERLDARYALFAIGAGDAPKDWMIHRMDPPDDPAREPMPALIVPMRARSGGLRRDDGRWAFEPRWAGERAIAHSEPGALRLQSAALRDITECYPELRRLGRGLGAHSAILDGVIAVLDAEGRPSPEALVARAQASGATRVRRLAQSLPVTFVIFDLLWLDGHALIERPYRERRAALAALELTGEYWRTPAHLEGGGRALLEAGSARALGGLVAKRLDSRYEPGRRSTAWISVSPPHPAAGESRERELTLGGRTASGRVRALAGGRELELSNLDKVLYPEAGFTKGQVIEYYAAIAPVMLPHLDGRPLTVTRYPDGVEAAAFFEKRSPRHRPDWVATLSVASERIAFTLADELATLVWLANLAALELHVPLGRAPRLERPTAVVFDLDPGPPATIIECCRVALWLSGAFERLGLRSFPKTSGSKGIQVYLPLNGSASYAQTKSFARSVAMLVERAQPELAVSRMGRALRRGKVLVDWSQNDPHKTTVAAYSLRARERPSVSTPVEWDEISGALEASDPARLVFDAAAVLARVAERGDLFAPVLSLVQALPHGQ